MQIAVGCEGIRNVAQQNIRLVRGSVQEGLHTGVGIVVVVEVKGERGGAGCATKLGNATRHRARHARVRGKRIHLENAVPRFGVRRVGVNTRMVLKHRTWGGNKRGSSAKK